MVMRVEAPKYHPKPPVPLARFGDRFGARFPGHAPVGEPKKDFWPSLRFIAKHMVKPASREGEMFDAKAMVDVAATAGWSAHVEITTRESFVADAKTLLDAGKTPLVALFMNFSERVCRPVYDDKHEESEAHWMILIGYGRDKGRDVFLFTDSSCSYYQCEADAMAKSSDAMQKTGAHKDKGMCLISLARIKNRFVVLDEPLHGFDLALLQEKAVALDLKLARKQVLRKSMLHRAVVNEATSANEPATVKQLLRRGHDPDSRTPSGETVRSETLEMGKNGADIALLLSEKKHHPVEKRKAENDDPVRRSRRKRRESSRLM